MLEPVINEASAPLPTQHLNTHFFFADLLSLSYCAYVFVCRFIDMNKLLLLIIVLKLRKKMQKFQSNCKFVVVLKKNQGIQSVHGAKRVTIAATIGPTSVTIMFDADGRLAK